MIIIDEAHERNVNTDVLIGFIIEALNLNPDLRVVITSATLDEELFKKYFGCKILKVSGRNYPVQIKYRALNDSENIIPVIKDLILQKIIPNKNKRDDYKGHILVFTSGRDEIEEFCNYMRK